jgi:hypothetical protein
LRAAERPPRLLCHLRLSGGFPSSAARPA